MKKMKGVVGEDAKTKSKHQSLMQDYQELQKETEAMNKKLERTKQKKLILLTEIEFLRRRYKYLMQNQSLKPQQEQHHAQAQQQNSKIRSKKVKEGKKHSGKEANLRYPVQNPEPKQMESIYSVKEAALRNPVPRIGVNRKRRISSGKEAGLGKPTPVFDLNQGERIDIGKEVTARNAVPVFDLNQISREEEEFQANCQPMIVEESKKCSINGVIDEQQNDMKLSVCRNARNGSSRAGKRKISWLDQVALRV